MFTVIALTTLSAFAPARAGWVSAGPERGHVLHAAVGAQGVAVATRVGVLSAPLDLTRWERDPRFPPEVRRLAFGPDGLAYAAPAGQLWRVGERGALLRFFERRSTVVDLCVSGSGALVAAVRGEDAGVLRVEGAEAGPGTLQSLPGRDPWRLSCRGEDVLLGTTAQGALRSRDGGISFEPWLEEGAVSAVGWVGAQAWVGLADGGLRMHEDGAWRVLPAVAGGYATAFAALPDGVLVSVQRGRQQHDALLVWDGASLSEIAPGQAGGDATVEDLTGVWALPDGAALVGSFRSGPLRLQEGRLVPARAGFRATVTGGAAQDRAGRLVLALMGTGVYVSDDQAGTWRSVDGPERPVTDSVAVVPDGDGVLVVDFEGVTRLDAQGRWRRLPRVPGLQPGEHLVSAASDAAGRVWSVDRLGRLYLLEAQSWRTCAQRGMRLDGRGEHLVLATPEGFLAQGTCDAPWEALVLDDPPRLDGQRSRAEGGWVAGGGAVWRGTKKTFAIPDLAVTALAARERELLVALEDGRVLRCAERCEPLPAPAPGRVAALGWLADGRVWLAEVAGTLLVEGDAPSPTAWTVHTDARRVTGDLVPLERAPWDDEAGPAPGATVPPRPPAAPAAGPAAPAPPSAGRSCGCAASGAPGAGLFGCLSPLLLLRARRARGGRCPAPSSL